MNTDTRINPLLDHYQEFKNSKTEPLKPSDYAHFLKEARKRLAGYFLEKYPIRSLLSYHAGLLDVILQEKWQQTGFTVSEASLIAVGGYGRKELHPASDVDLLILLHQAPDELAQERISQLLTFLWDMGIEVGHSVRTLDECLQAARTDLTVITNLIEARLLAGSRDLYHHMRAGISPENMWDSRSFFLAKLAEQRTRYVRFGDTAYRVEPNLKEGPGGLRDIHMIGWIIEREYGHLSLAELHEHRLLDQSEYECLREGQAFLWSVRFVLHTITNRKEDRLLFDYQHTLAKTFGYQQEHRNEAVEAFMQRYYKTITELERLTDVLTGILRVKLEIDEEPQPVMVGEWYQKRGNLLAVNSPDTFTLYPTALLEIFVFLQNTPGVTGLAPETIRLMRSNLHRIDSGFRQQFWHRQIFMQILRQPSGITFVLRLMNRYGILAAYLPAFANIVGRMQYDLFHAYTVDEHTLFVISNVRRYSTEKGAAELPMCSEIFKRLQKPELLYLAALFHDIAKGRNGDHSELGAVDAYDFCREHGLNVHDASLVSWLVQKHLLMSVTAQRKDISDPSVIQEFAEQIIAQNRLDYLFLLTIADIKGTNPKLWNSWRRSLLTELYLSTRNLLNQRLPASEKSASIIAQKRNSALEYLCQAGFSEEACINLWKRLGEDYLLQHSVESICWHAQSILNAQPEDFPLVKMRSTISGSSNIIFIYSADLLDLFTRVVSTLEQLNLNIVQARIVSMEGNGFDLYTLHILGPDSKIVDDPSDQQHIVEVIKRNLLREHFQVRQHRTPRILRNFDVPTHIQFRQQPEKKLTVMEVSTGDMPGLLSRVGEVLDQVGVRVHNARITTLGEQAEDIFYITTRDDEMITDPSTQAWISNLLGDALKI